jgi:hypothetical protein
MIWSFGRAKCWVSPSCRMLGCVFAGKQRGRQHAAAASTMLLESSLFEPIATPGRQGEGKGAFACAGVAPKAGDPRGNGLTDENSSSISIGVQQRVLGPRCARSEDVDGVHFSVAGSLRTSERLLDLQGTTILQESMAVVIVGSSGGCRNLTDWFATAKVQIVPQMLMTLLNMHLLEVGSAYRRSADISRLRLACLAKRVWWHQLHEVLCCACTCAAAQDYLTFLRALVAADVVAAGTLSLAVTRRESLPSSSSTVAPAVEQGSAAKGARPLCIVVPGLSFGLQLVISITDEAVGRVVSPSLSSGIVRQSYI